MTSPTRSRRRIFSSAAYLIESAYQYFPVRTIHVLVVDPGVGTTRAILAAEINGHIFLAPDNGILSCLTDQVQKLIRVENARYFLPSVSRTFHGRDIFVPLAAHLSAGTSIEELGTPIAHSRMVQLSVPKPYMSDGAVFGEISYIDRFGNLQTNIRSSMLDSSLSQKEEIEIHLKDHRIIGLSKSYADVRAGEPVMLINSRGYLEISVNSGNAAAFFKAGRGDNVTIHL